VAPNEALMHLQRKIESALQRIGLEAESRKYTPHVTLARLKGTRNGHVVDFLADHALYSSGPFAVDGFILYSSKMTSDGSIYRAEKAYRLGKV
jgi:RNA 2',3'-cyclic 3'-phosphodiesterase